MNGRIDLKDGFCVSCGLESGVLYHSCPFCDELVWHPLWRRILFWYIVAVLPFISMLCLITSSASLHKVLDAYMRGSWQMQLLIASSAGLLFLPYENHKLILSSKKSRLLWVLNSSAASAILLLCMLLFAVTLLLPDTNPVLRSAACFVAVSGFSTPLVLNCSWWRLIPAVLLWFAIIGMH